jgi:hypothetical protein
MTTWYRLCFAFVVPVLLVACGHHMAGAGDPGGNADGGVGGSIDAPMFSGMCNPGGPQCSNCKDDDNDGKPDGFDLQCTGPNDNDESSFGTGIPGDNMDPVEQDCFFDGDSGAGNDRCNIHVCCLLGATTTTDCPDNLGRNKYHPEDCPPPIGTRPLDAMCIKTCGKLAPPGCDCFACCTIFDAASGHFVDIDINPAVSPDCTPATLSDPTRCLRCTKNEQCNGGACGDGTCTLCPGQINLPPSCTSGVSCPNGEDACTNGACPPSTYCSNGCCIGVIL